MTIFGIQNPTISQRLRALFGFKSLFSDASVEYTPVIQVNDPHFYTKQQIVRSANATGTIYVVENDSTKQFYIDGFCLSCASATDTTVLNSISAQIDGVAQVIAQVDVTSITISGGIANVAVAKDFAVPLRIDRNSNITFALGTSNAGRGIIYGHYEKQI